MTHRNQIHLFTALAAVSVLLAAALPAVAAPAKSPAERGAYLVSIMGCHDCHTPWKLGEKGPGPDLSRSLSGHPADLVVSHPPTFQEPWVWGSTATNTAFAGPWGISFAANLTPDPETGLGKWTEETFLKTIRTGRHMGAGRPVLPPMPVAVYSNATDEDLKAIFAYLRTLKPIKNAVSQPIEPAGER